MLYCHLCLENSKSSKVLSKNGPVKFYPWCEYLNCRIYELMGIHMKQVQEEANVLGDRESKFLDVLEI